MEMKLENLLAWMEGADTEEWVVLNWDRDCERLSAYGGPWTGEHAQIEAWTMLQDFMEHGDNVEIHVVPFYRHSS